VWVEPGADPIARQDERGSGCLSEKLNHADAVKAHPDALISWAVKL
jgi:hypothetical protein